MWSARKGYESGRAERSRELGLIFGKEPNLIIRTPGESLTIRRKLTNKSPKQRSRIERRDDNPTRYFTAKSDNGKDQFNGRAVDEPLIVPALVVERLLSTDP